MIKRKTDEVAENFRVRSVMTIEDLTEDERYRYEERAAIMQYDGGLEREEAERQAWCREICMLTPEQRLLCERVIPCPKIGVINEV